MTLPVPRPVVVQASPPRVQFTEQRPNRVTITAPGPQGPRGPIGGSDVTGESGVSVLAYGAAGDGVTDDTEAIQDAIDAAGVGGRVFFPPTVAGYAISAPVVPLRQQRLIGSYQTKFEAGLGPEIAPGALRAAATFTGAALIVGTPTSFGVHIENMALIGPGAGHASNCAGIRLPESDDYIGELGWSVRESLINNCPGPGICGHLWVFDMVQCTVSQCSWGMDLSGPNALLDARILTTQFTFNRDGGVRLAGTRKSGAYSFIGCRFERSGNYYTQPWNPLNADAPGIEISNSGHGYFQGETDANTGPGLRIGSDTEFVYNHTFAMNFVRDGGGAQVPGYGWLWTEELGWHEVPLGTTDSVTITDADIPGVDLGRCFYTDLSASRVSYGAQDDSGNPVPIPGGGGATCPPPLSPSVGVRAANTTGLQLASRVEILPQHQSLDVADDCYNANIHLPYHKVMTVPVVDVAANRPTNVDMTGLILFNNEVNSLQVRNFAGLWQTLFGWDGTNPGRLSPIIDLYGAAGADQAVRFYQDDKIRALIATDDVTGDLRIDVYDLDTEAFLGSPLTIRNDTRLVETTQQTITPDGTGRVLCYFNAPAGQTGAMVEYRVDGTLIAGVTAAGAAYGPDAAAADQYIPLGQLQALVAASATWADFQSAIAAL